MKPNRKLRSLKALGCIAVCVCLLSLTSCGGGEGDHKSDDTSSKGDRGEAYFERIHQKGTYDQTKYSNNEVVIRIIEGYLQEEFQDTVSGRNAQFTMSQLTTASKESKFDVHSSHGKWSVQVEIVSPGEFAFEVKGGRFDDIQSQHFERLQKRLTKLLGG